MPPAPYPHTPANAQDVLAAATPLGPQSYHEGNRAGERNRLGLHSSGAHFVGGRRDNNSGLGIVGSLLMLVLAPLAAMIVQMAISRTCEYAADRLGARASGRPGALASALVKISRVAEAVPNETAESHPATAPLFIINPLSGRGMDNLSDPSTENRIAELDRLSREMGVGGLDGPSAMGRDTGPWNDGRGSGRWESGEKPRGPWG